MIDALLSMFRLEITTDTVLIEMKWIVPLAAILLLVLVHKLKGLKK